MKLVIASNNAHKINEYKVMFSPLGIEVLSPNELNINEEPEENGKTYEENSLIKAKAIAKHTSFPVLADDSGLNVKALNDFPGIYSARFAKENGGNEKANIVLIEKLKQYKDKSAEFVCVITLLNIANKPLQFKGLCPGYIMDKPHGQGGFGYDPIFFSKEANVCFGEAQENIKNEFSHRAKALKAMIEYLKDNKLI